MEDPTDLKNLESIGAVVRDFHEQSRVPLSAKEQKASDREELERELNYKAPYRDRRFFKTRPPGYNVMVALGAFFALLGFLLGGISTLAVLGGGKLSEFLACIVGFVLAAILGYKLPRIIWRGIGPTGRGVLRVFGYLGAGPILIVCFLSAALLVNGLKATLGQLRSSDPTPMETSQEPPVVEVGPLSGADWQFLVDADKKPLTLTLAEAHTRCKALGEGWRLPRLQDQALINSKVTNPHWQSCAFHFDNGEDFHGFFDFSELTKAWGPHAVMDDLPRQVLCLRAP